MVDLGQYEHKTYSQNGEDGITEKIIDLVYGEDKYYKVFVEFGTQNGDECNTNILRYKYYWTGLLMDGGFENIKINLKKEFITKENIVSLFKKYNVPKHANLLSLDLDFNDFYILKEILKEYVFDILIVEYNATHNVNEDKVIIYNQNQMWDNSNYFGASLLAFYNLCSSYNYSLVYCCNPGVNAFFIHNDILVLMNEKILDYNNIEKLYKKANYSSGPNGGHPQDRYNRPYITSVEAMKL
jgi:hypothetical protein